MSQASRYSPSYEEVETWLAVRRQYDSNANELETIADIEEALRSEHFYSTHDEDTGHFFLQLAC